MLYTAAPDDWISRPHVYELWNLIPNARIAGFAKPFDGVRRMLAEEGLLDERAAGPITSQHPERGGWALGLDLDPS